MQEILEIIFEHSAELIFFWIIFFISGLLLLRKSYWSIFDPIVYQLFIAIAPGVSGLLVVAFYINKYPGSEAKIGLMFLSIVGYFYFYKINFSRYGSEKHEIIIREPFSWQLLLTLSCLFINVLNILINGNFEDKDPALRFSKVAWPFLNYLSISVTIYPAVIFAFTRNVKIIVISALAIIVTALVQLQVGASKSFFITFLMMFFYWNFSRKKLNVNEILEKLRKFSIPKSVFKYAAVSMFLVVPGVVYLLILGVVDVGSMGVRFLLSLDSPVIYVSSNGISFDSSGNFTGFNNFLEVWFKPFFKNFIGVKYDFENISQYLAFEMTGYRANTYEETGWQPNNNMSVDFLILHGWFGVVLSGAFGYFFGHLNNILKRKISVSRWSLPFFILLVISPFYAWIDAQSFFTSAILSTIFVYFVNFIHDLLLIRNGPDFR